MPDLPYSVRELAFLAHPEPVFPYDAIHPADALAHLEPVFPYDAIQLTDALTHQTTLPRLNDSGVSLYSQPLAPLHYFYNIK